MNDISLLYDLLIAGNRDVKEKTGQLTAMVIAVSPEPKCNIILMPYGIPDGDGLRPLVHADGNDPIALMFFSDTSVVRLRPGQAPVKMECLLGMMLAPDGTRRVTMDFYLRDGDAYVWDRRDDGPGRGEMVGRIMDVLRVAL